jgi:hypothetical protein
MNADERRTVFGAANRPKHTTVYNTRFDNLARLLRMAGRTTRFIRACRAFSGAFRCFGALLCSPF